MSDFRRLTDTMLASPQIDPADLDEAAKLGVTLVINNRPDGEADEQPEGATVEAAAKALGMDYVAIPVTHAGFSMPQVEAMRAALDKAQGPVLAYCRSGTRSTLLWSLAQASSGADLPEVIGAADRAGYDLTPILAAMESLSQAAGN